MESNVAALIAAITVIVGLSVTYAKTFGSYQERLTEIVIQTFAIRTRYKPVANLGVGLLLTTVVTVVAAYSISAWLVIPAGVIAGLFASVEAQRVHDEAKPPPA